MLKIKFSEDMSPEGKEAMEKQLSIYGYAAKVKDERENRRLGRL